MLGEDLDQGGNRSLLAFPYTLEQTKDCINETERQLRDLVTAVLAAAYGCDWEQEVWSEGERKEMAGRRRSEQTRFPHQHLPERLLDYSHLVDLLRILREHWVHFQHIFRSRERTLVLFELLHSLRNSEMHGRAGLMPHQRHLCLGICGEFILAIDHWRQGYDQGVEACVVALDLQPDQLQGWLAAVAKAEGREPQPKAADDGQEAWLLRLPGGHVRVTAGEQGLTVRSACTAALGRVLAAGGRPYRRLTYELRGDLDVEGICRDARALAGRVPVDGAGGSAAFALGSLLLTLAPATAQRPAAIAVEGEAPFWRAHAVLPVGRLLAMVYGHVAPAELTRLVGEACEPAGRA